MPLDLRKALPGDKLQRNDGSIRYFAFCNDTLAVLWHTPNGDISGAVDLDGIFAKDSIYNVIRNLSQEEREAKSKSSLIFGAAMVGSQPTVRRCECCGQEMKP